MPFRCPTKLQQSTWKNQGYGKNVNRRGEVALSDYAVLVRPILQLATHKYSTYVQKTSNPSRWFEIVRLLCKHAGKELATVLYVLKSTVMRSCGPLTLFIELMYTKLIEEKENQSILLSWHDFCIVLLSAGNAHSPLVAMLCESSNGGNNEGENP